MYTEVSITCINSVKKTIKKPTPVDIKRNLPKIFLGLKVGIEFFGHQLDVVEMRGVEYETGRHL